MSTGAIDVETFGLYAGTGQLEYILKSMVKNGTMNPFSCEIYDQKHNLVNKTANCMSASEIINIDWLVDIVEGTIPDISQFKEESHELLSQLGVRLNYEK